MESKEIWELILANQQTIKKTAQIYFRAYPGFGIDDCVQEVILLLVKKMQIYKAKNNCTPKSFLTRCARTIVFDINKKNERQKRNDNLRQIIINEDDSKIVASRLF